MTYQNEALRGKQTGFQDALADMLAEDKAAKRREQYRKSKRARRTREAVLGGRTIAIDLTASDLELLCRCANQQKGPLEGVYKRFLLAGAKFCANAGAPRGGKVK